MAIIMEEGSYKLQGQKVKDTESGFHLTVVKPKPKYTSQPKGVVKPKRKPKPIPFDSQVKTALIQSCT